jgi:iron complex transport system permease protein
MVFAACLILLLAAIGARIAVGGVPPDTNPSPDEPVSFFKSPIIELRAQRAAAGLVVGSAVAVAGVLLQCLFRNPLASPDLLGMASGAGLGVMTAAYISYKATGMISQVGLGATGPPALVGALGALGLTYLFSQRKGFIDPPSLLLVGVIIGVLAASMTQFVQYLLPDRGLAASRWLLGAISDDITWGQSALIGAIVVVVAGISAKLGPALDAATLGDDEARSLGVPIGPLRGWMFIASGVLAASSVVIAGPVAFIGLICPHLVRMAAGPLHRPLIICAALAGGALVIWADTLVKAVNLASGRLPISVLTSLIGGPLLIFLLRKRPVVV